MSDPTIEDGAQPDPVDALMEFVNASDKSREYAETCVEEATALVSVYVGSATVPPAIVARAVLEVGSELFHRKHAPSGIRQFANPGEQAGGPRLAKDAMTRAYPMLNPYLVGGFA